MDVDGVGFLIDEQLRGWLAQGEELLVDYNEQWKHFSVRLAGASAC